MTPETAQAIVDGVAERHPKFKVVRVEAGSVGGKATFEEPTVDPRRIGYWFEEAQCSVTQVGYNAIAKEWYIYFREAAK